MSRVAAVFRRCLLASVALALLAGGPSAPMAIAPIDGLPIAAHASPVPHASHGAHGTQRHPVPAPYHRHTECCDLCVMHCGAAFAPVETLGVPAAAVRAVVAPQPVLVAPRITPLRYRLPPALAPPTLLV